MLGQQDIFESITPKQTQWHTVSTVMLCDPWEISCVFHIPLHVVSEREGIEHWK